MVKPLSRTLAWSNADCVEPVTVQVGLVVSSLWADELRRHAAIVELLPGGTWRRTRDAAAEAAMFVLAGVLEDEVRSYPRGTFIHRPEGHDAVLRSRDGCQVLVLETNGQLPSTLHRVPDRVAAD